MCIYFVSINHTVPFSLANMSSFLLFFFWLPHGIWSSWVRDQIQATVVTYTTAAQPTVLGQGSNLHPGAAETLPIPFRLSRNSNMPSLLFF